ncbi:NAD-glutamate dehydrogenase [Leptolyngbya sp. 15MV]|nr:NAD-glutamate dehydrogenase [Leptolyngbya sp. 15MV]
MGSKAGETAGAPARRLAGHKQLAAALAEQMRDSLLPGDTPFGKAEMGEAAAFLLDTAARRPEGEPALHLATSTEGRRMMRIALVNDDMPFLVDSVAATFSAQGLPIDRLVHPVVPVRRNAAGDLAAIDEAAGFGWESMIYIETARVDARQRRALEQALRTTLGDVHAAVRDWPRMREKMRADAEALGDREGAALLKWLEGGMLTLLGHVTRRRDGGHAELLGICKRSAKQILADASYERAFAWFDDPRRSGERVPLIVKANRLSNVHRRVPLDLFIVPVREGQKVVAISIHAGVWTSAALAAPPTKVPRMRAQLTALMDKFDFDPVGHAGKALVHALTELPHDLLIGFSDADIERVSTAMMSLVDRPRPRLALVEAPLARHLFAFVWLPRDMLSTQVRLQIQDLLESGTGTDMLDWSLQVEGGNLATLRFVLDLRGTESAYDEAALDAELQRLLRGWGEAVETELAETMEAGRAAAIAGRLADAFPTAYRAAYGPREAALDIGRMRHLPTGDAETAGATLRDARLFHLPGDAENLLRLKVYEHEGALPLSDAVPALENFGFRVLTEIPTALAGGELGTIPANASKSAGCGRTYIIPLVELDPPSTLPRTQNSGWRLSPALRLATKGQTWAGLPRTLAIPRGTWISGLRSGGPASISSTRLPGSAESRSASTQPAVPAPTIT